MLGLDGVFGVEISLADDLVVLGGVVDVLLEDVDGTVILALVVDGA
jgi:hypothetical protein